MKKAKNQAVRKYSTDGLAKNLWQTLLSDFRAFEGRSFCEKAENAFHSGVMAFRGYDFPECGIVDPMRYKMYAQMESVLKKYRFAEDLYTDEELFNRTVAGYFDDQLRLTEPMATKLSSSRVLQTARKIAASILGDFTQEEIVASAKFGKKSSIGCPLSLAYIDHKLTNIKAFTGSSECVEWFKEVYLPGDPLLTSIVKPLLGSENTMLEHDSLNLITVPKTWKKLRLITPLTLVGLFYSYGIGGVVEDRLKSVGLNISTLQHRHRRLVKKFSTSFKYGDCHGGSHMTADLSSASDSLTSELLNRILPRKWYTLCKKMFSHQVLIDGKAHYTSSVLPMGNGATFPLETLIFYCLIKAIGTLTGTRGIYSVYGDDLIYPSSIHKYVATVFPDLRLKLNGDKTFRAYPFRESCGADYYRGVDVRPFQFKGEHRELTRTQYLAELYKVYNGLLVRWGEEMITRTLRFLLTEMTRVSDLIHRVPPSYPETSGIRVRCFRDIPLKALMFPWSETRCIAQHGSRWYTFRLLQESRNKRYVERHLPYYWLKLSGGDDEPFDHSTVSPITASTLLNLDRYFRDPPSVLQWEKTFKYIKRFFGKKTKVKRVKRKRPYVSARAPLPRYAYGQVRSGSISDWL